MGFISLARNMRAANAGADKQVDLFRRLGVSQGAISQGDTGQVIDQLADAFAAMPAGAQKAAIAQQLFGRQAQTLLPLLDKGSAGLREQLQLADRYGATLDKAGVKKALEAAQAQREMTLAMDGLKLQFGSALLPSLTQGVVAVSSFASRVRRIMARDDLSRDEKLNRIGDLMADKVETGLPKLANNAARIAPKIVVAFVKGWLRADVWGKLIGAAWILSMFGPGPLDLIDLFRRKGGKAGTGFGRALAARVLTIASRVVVPLAVASVGYLVYKKLATRLPDAGPETAGARERYATELESRGYDVERFVGRDRIKVTTPAGKEKVVTVPGMGGGRSRGAHRPRNAHGSAVRRRAFRSAVQASARRAPAGRTAAPRAKQDGTAEERLEAKLALAELTPSLDDDLAALRAQERHLSRTLKRARAARDPLRAAAAASGLKSTRDAIREIQSERQTTITGDTRIDRARAMIEEYRAKGQDQYAEETENYLAGLLEARAAERSRRSPAEASSLRAEAAELRKRPAVEAAPLDTSAVDLERARTDALREVAQLERQRLELSQRLGGAEFGVLKQTIADLVSGRLATSGARA